MFNELEFAVSMFIVFVLAFARGWVVGNRAGKDDSYYFMPGERVWFYNDLRNTIEKGRISAIFFQDNLVIWRVEVGKHTKSIYDKYHIFKNYEDAEQFLNYVKEDENFPNVNDKQ